MKEAHSPHEAADVRDVEAKGHGSRSQSVRQLAIVALLSEPTLGSAATRCGVNERTLRRWLAQPVFHAEYAAARQAMFEAALSRAQALAARAIETLEDLLGGTQQASVRLGAARAIVDLGIHHHDTDTIVQRLSEIEARQQRQQKR